MSEFGLTIDEDDYLEHYGIARKSGRYPWGSGKDKETRSRDFLGAVAELRQKGMSDVEIARAFSTPDHPFTTTDLRATNTIARNAKKQADIGMAQRLKDKGYSNTAIGQRMGINESSVRALLAPGVKDKADILQVTSNMLRDQVDRKGMVDVGIGVEHHIGVSREKLNTALAVLKSEGYSLENVQVDQVGTGNKTLIKVLAKPGTTYKDIVSDKSQIQSITEFSEDGGRSMLGLQKPLSIDSSRIAVRYGEDGGATADGVIYVRPGKDDISLGANRYAQVRVAVDGTHYLKGMAIYKDDLPNGVDLQFNTNKTREQAPHKLDAMKAMKDDPDDPFGAVVRQIIDPSTNKVTSAMNLVNEEGDWNKWSKSLASQMLSKQKPTLAKQQLDKAYDDRKKDLDEIMNLTNPAVRKKLLESYADDADAASVHLKAAALPRQRSQVILPVNSMKDTEIYAQNFRDGERVALVRYPHGGTFEIPELTVNNQHPDAKKLLGDAKDAVGINSKVAERLSGADFDGDTVLVIPNNSGHVKSTSALSALKNFDPKSAYPAYEGMKKMTPKQKQQEMGKVSNLITDMTIKGANTQEIAQAVKHSMVVIDAEKHNLNYKQSYIDNGIAKLKEKYQGGADRGASTLISRTTSEVRVDARKPRSAAKGGPIDKMTGEKVFENTGESYVKTKVNKKTGQITESVIKKTMSSTKGAEAKDAHSLSSGTKMEEIYANHSNRLKDLANSARREMVNTHTIPYSPSAKKVYDNEVKSLDAKLKLALRNAPLERQAQLVANTVIKAKKQANPDMDGDELKKISGKALTEARARTGAGKDLVDITDKEWEAIQSGAITNNKLEKILNNSDLTRVKELATPRTQKLMTSSKQAQAKSMIANGATRAEVADALGVSLSTLQKSLES